MPTPLGGETFDTSTQGVHSSPGLAELKRRRESALWARLYWEGEVARLDQEIAEVAQPFLA